MTPPTIRKLVSEIEGLPGGILALLGVVLGTLVLAFLATHPDPPVWWETEVAVAVVFSSVVVYAGYRLNSEDFDSSDAWRVLQLSVAGMVGAVAIGGILYVHQTMEGRAIAEPTFVFEYLGLTGGALGAGYGLLSTPASEDETEQKEDTQETEDASDVGATQEAVSKDDGAEDVVALLGGDATAEAAKDRLSIVECLVEDGGGETPVPSLAVFLTRRESFSEDAKEVESLLRENHLPALSEAGVVEVYEDVDIVRYTGPENVPSQLREKETV